MVKRPDMLKRLIAARTGLVFDKPFYAGLAPRLEWKEDLSCRTGWTDGVHIGYNPKWVEKQTIGKLQTFIAHECGHCMAGHPWRRNGRDFKRWNKACDRGINPVLREEGYEMPDNILYELEPSHFGKSAEWLFEREPIDPPKEKQQKQQGKAGPPQEGDGDGAGSDPGGDEDQDSDAADPDDQDSEGSDGEEDAAGSDTGDEKEDAGDEAGGDAGDEDGDESGEMDGGSEPDEEYDEDEFGEVRDAPTEPNENGDAPVTEAEWRQATATAITMAKMRGDFAGALARFAESTIEDKTDWPAVMLRFAQETARADYTWMKPNMRWAAHGLYMPSLWSQEVGVIVAVRDTSGSVDQVMLNQFNGTLNGIQRSVNPRKIVIIDCDADVQSIREFERDEIIPLDAVGGGGTDFRPAFEAIAKMDEPPVCVVFLTDLYGVFPETDPGIPVLWVTPTKTVPVPFGEIVNTE